VRYPVTALLAAAAAAVLAGAKSLVAIGEWVADAPQHVLAQLRFQTDRLTGVIRPPHAGTIRLVLLAVDGDVLDTAIGRYLQERRPAPEQAAAVRRPIAVDGDVLAAHAPRTRPRPHCWPLWTTRAASWPSDRSPTRATRYPPSPRCSTLSIWNTL
jgi:hypothetical protein